VAYVEGYGGYPSGEIMRRSSAFLASRRLDPMGLARHPCRALSVDESEQVNSVTRTLICSARSGQFVIQGGDTAGESDQDMSACLVGHHLVEPASMPSRAILAMSPGFVLGAVPEAAVSVAV
jgi:hypothetical protein